VPSPNTTDRCPIASAPDDTLVAVIEISQSNWLIAVSATM
jgi:hypothetical protein